MEKHEYASRDEYRAWLIDGKFREQFGSEKADKHTASPFGWITTDEAASSPLYVGGCDDCGALWKRNDGK